MHPFSIEFVKDLLFIHVSVCVPSAGAQPQESGEGVRYPGAEVTCRYVPAMKAPETMEVPKTKLKLSDSGPLYLLLLPLFLLKLRDMHIKYFWKRF